MNNQRQLQPQGFSQPSPGTVKRRDRRASYLFAYDITDPKRSHKVRRCLQRWRVDGQYSVHETLLLPFQAQELATELVELMDRQLDRLLVARLSRRGNGPVYILSQSPLRPQLVSENPAQPLPKELHDGWYLLAYDIREPQRLQKVQKETAVHCTFAQKSVYLYHGSGAGLLELMESLHGLIEKHNDDVRLYALNNSHDLWFPSGVTPPLAGLSAQGQEPESTLWRRLLRWLKAAA